MDTPWWCTLCSAMDCRHFTMKQKRKRKKPVARTPEAVAKFKESRTPEAVAKFKELFLKQLELGRSPGVAARNVRIARATAYGWKKADQEFDAAWIDAVETGLDLLETKLYDSGMKGNSQDAQFILRYRRYNNDGGRPQQSNFSLNITLEEQYKRLERLGIPLPVIESDYEEEDDETDRSRGT
jgi:hypothetical protein